MKQQIINAACASSTEDGIWFVHYVLPILMFYDKKEKTVTKARVIENTDSGMTVPYNCMYVYDDEIILFPNNAKHILLYKISSDMFEIIGKEFDDTSLFRAVYRIGDMLYVIPFRYKYVLKMDLTTKNVYYLEGFESQFGDNKYTNSCCIFGDRYIVCAMPYTNSFAIFNTKTEKWRKVHTPHKNLTSIAASENILWGFEYETKKIVGFNMEFDELVLSECIEMTGAHLFCMSHNVIANDAMTGIMKIYNEQMDFINEFIPNVIKSNLSSEYLYGIWFCDQENTYCITKGNELFIADDNAHWAIYKLAMDEDLWKNLAIEYMKLCGQMIKENELLTLDSFINTLL